MNAHQRRIQRRRNARIRAAWERALMALVPVISAELRAVLADDSEARPMAACFGDRGVLPVLPPVVP